MSACPNRFTATLFPIGSKPILSRPLTHESGTRRQLPRGAYFFRPGDPADSLCFVESGLVKLSVSSEAGRDLTLGLYGAGDFFGEEVILAAGERFAFAVALEPTALVVFPRAFVRELSDRDRDFALFLTRLLSARLRDSADRMESFAWGSVPARLAEALLRLAEPRGRGARGGVAPAPDSGKGREGTRVRVRLTHQELANLIGSTRETTTATLNVFRRRGWIDFVRREILLRRPDLLWAAAQARN